MDRNTDLGTVVKHSKVEIAPSDIGSRILDGEQLHQYDPKVFTLLVFPENVDEAKLESYLRAKRYQFAYIGPLEAILVPRTVMPELIKEFSAEEGVMQESYDGSQWPPAEP